MTNQCPLCKSNKVVYVESLSVKELNQRYYNLLEICDALKSNSLNYLQCQSCNLGFFDPMETGGEAFYETLQKKNWYYMDDKEEFKIACSCLDNGTVLEVGAGKAAFAKYVNKKNYTGLEFNEAAIKKAAEEGITLLKEAIEDHALKGKKYDAVVSFQVLEHISSPRSFLESCIQCLKPNGKLIVAVPSEDGIFGLASNNILSMPPHHVTRWSEKTLIELANLFNLNCYFIQHEPIVSYHKKSAHSIIIQDFLKRKLGIKKRLLEDRYLVRLIEKVSGKLATIIQPSLDEYYGHTIIACYEKIK